MTYCLGIRVDDGLVLLSDTRTHAGVDNVARYQKMFVWEREGEGAICLCTAGNLSLTQSVVNYVNDGVGSGGAQAGDIFQCRSMHEVAELIGARMREVSARHKPALKEAGVNAAASIIVGGVRPGGAHRMFLVYSAGNFIETDPETPYLQIGEFKYGKPILDRVLSTKTSLAAAEKAALLSMDATCRSNLSVAPPLDLAVMRAEENGFAIRRRIMEDDPDLLAISRGWSEALNAAFAALPEVG